MALIYEMHQIDLLCPEDMATPRANSEDPDLQMAIERSFLGTQQGKVADPEDATTKAEGFSPAKTRGIEDCIAELRQKKRFIEFPRLDIADGDTLIYIDAPPACGNPNDPLHVKIQERYGRPFRMDSSSLKAANSAILNKKLGPDYQFRILRRRNLVGKLPAGVKYVLDLTPSLEGDEAVAIISELCCSWGVRLWGLSKNRWRISDNLVGGRDELTHHNPQNRIPKKDFMKSIAAAQEAEKKPQQPCTGEVSMPPADPDMGAEIPEDYSDLRHRVAIERVLMALQGFDPYLNSAPKVYSAAIISMALDITCTPLTDYITSWLRAEPNTRFVEALPEDTIKITESVRCASICIDAFAMLVGEAALDHTFELRRGFPRHLGDQARSSFGRVKGDLHEAWQSRVEHARDVMTDRVKAMFESLVDRDMTWVDSLAELRKIPRPNSHDSDYANAYTKLVDGLKDFIRGSIYHILASDYAKCVLPEEDNSPGGDVLYPRINLEVCWSELHWQERVFTRFFWYLLKAFRIIPRYYKHNLNVSFTNLLVNIGYIPEGPHATLHGEALMDAGIYRQVRVSEIEKLIEECYQQYYCRPERDGVLNPFPGSSSTATSLSLPIRSSGSASLDSGWSGSNNTLLAEEVEPKNSAPLAHSQKENEMDQVNDDLRLITLLRFFSFEYFLHNAQAYLEQVANEMLRGPAGGNIAPSPTEFNYGVNLTQTLVCLQDSETRFLPLWAGGDDDGTNGVFDHHVPQMPDGVVNPNLGYRCGHASTSATSSGFEMLGGGRSTIGTSTVVNDGYSQPEHRMDRRVAYSVADHESFDGNSIYFSEAATDTTNSPPGLALDNLTPAESRADNEEWEQLEQPQHQQAQLQPRQTSDAYDDIFTAADDELDFEYDSDMDLEEEESYRGFDNVSDEPMGNPEHVSTLIKSPVEDKTPLRTPSPKGKGKAKATGRRTDSDEEDWDLTPSKRQKTEFVVYKSSQDQQDQERP